MFKRMLAAIAALVLLLPGTGFAAGLTKNERSLLRQMNRVRAEHGLRSLRYDTHLERAARFHTREMIGADVFSHGAFAARMAEFAVAGRVAGENLAWGTGHRATARAIVAAWLASPEHRANLLRPSFRRVGVGDLIGAFQGQNRAHVVTADFAG
jgi:uncharacterized protein YkwD